MSGKEDQLAPNRIPSNDVSTYPADAQRLQTYADAEKKLAQFQAPLLIHADKEYSTLRTCHP